MANLKIKVIDPKKLIFALEEPGQIGDTICLKDLNAIDFSDWNQEVMNYENEQIKNIIKSETEKIKLKTKDEYKDEINKLKDEKQKLIHDKELMEKDKKLELSNLRKEKDDEITKLNKQKDEEIIKLNNEISNLNNNFNDKLNLKTYELENEYIKKENDIKNEKEKLINAKDQEINNLKDKLDNLKREKNLLSIKALGEELEQWCYNEYHSIMGNLAEDCSFEKANIIYDIDGNKSKSGQKPDFIFSVYDRPISQSNKILLGSVTLEMKTKTETQNKKTTNDSFLSKLNQDMLNSKSDYGVLVTELEPDKPIIINKAQEYNNIFIVRPHSMIALLTILRSIILKQKDIKREEIKFKDSKKILDEWNDFKNNLLDKTIKNINKNLDDIQTSVETARSALDKIQNARDIIFNKHIQTVINKIDNFSMQKCTKLINNISNNLESQYDDNTILNKISDNNDDV